MVGDALNPAEAVFRAIQHYLVRPERHCYPLLHGLSWPERPGKMLSYTTLVHGTGTGRTGRTERDGNGTGRTGQSHQVLYLIRPVGPVGPVTHLIRPVGPVGPVILLIGPLWPVGQYTTNRAVMARRASISPVTGRYGPYGLINPAPCFLLPCFPCFPAFLLPCFPASCSVARLAALEPRGQFWTGLQPGPERASSFCPS